MKPHMTVVAAISALVTVLIYPVLTYDEGTSRNITVEVLAEPYANGDVLVYRWKGDVYRSCDVTIRRSFIDSDKVVTNLTPLVIEAMPYAQLGPAVYEVRVVVPRQIAVGPAVYKAVEVPSCTWVQKIWPPEVPYPLVEFHVTPIKDPRA